MSGPQRIETGGGVWQSYFCALVYNVKWVERIRELYEKEEVMKAKYIHDQPSQMHERTSHLAQTPTRSLPRLSSLEKCMW